MRNLTTQTAAAAAFALFTLSRVAAAQNSTNKNGVMPNEDIPFLSIGFAVGALASVVVLCRENVRESFVLNVRNCCNWLFPKRDSQPVANVANVTTSLFPPPPRSEGVHPA